MSTLDPQAARVLLVLLLAMPGFAALCAHGIASAKRRVQRDG
ncbi:MAG: hypothetical protein V4720_06345 [Pseudomonadota bacterium]